MLTDTSFSPTKTDHLGKDASIVAKSDNAKEFNQWRQLAHAQKLLIDDNVKTSRTDNPHRTRFCHAVRAWNAESVEIKIPVDSTQTSARFAGTQTCGSVWSCPVCAKKIAIQRGDEIKHTIRVMNENGFVPIMITLTASHTIDMKLDDFKERKKAAWRKMSQDGSYRRLKKRWKIEHTIKANEVTWSHRNGWHYHSHGLLFLPVSTIREMSDGELQKFTDDLKNIWLRCLRENGLVGSWEHALDVKAHGEIEETYLAKLGFSDETTNLNYELSSGMNKASSGLNIWQILEKSGQGRNRYSKLYVEYVRAMSGDNWITFSHGLKDLVGLNNDSDDELAQNEETDPVYETLLELTDKHMAIIREYRAYHDVIKMAAQTRSKEHVLNLINNIRDIVLETNFEQKIIKMEKQLDYLKLEKFEIAASLKQNPRSKFVKQRLERCLEKINSLENTLENYRLGNLPF